MRRFWSLMVLTVREIFDESAYTRFLARSEMVRSRESYAAFLRENGAVQERRPRRC